MYKLIFIIFVFSTYANAKDFGCLVEFTDVSKSLKLRLENNKTTKFKHPKQSLEEYEIKKTSHQVFLKVHNYLTKKKDQFLRYEINCASNLSCSGERVYTSETENRVQTFSISAQNYSTTAKIGNRGIFHFSQQGKSSHLFFQKYSLNKKEIGTSIKCGEIDV